MAFDVVYTTAHGVVQVGPLPLEPVSSRGGCLIQICTKAHMASPELGSACYSFIILSIIPFVALKIHLDIN